MSKTFESEPLPLQSYYYDTTGVFDTTFFTDNDVEFMTSSSFTDIDLFNVTQTL